MFGTPAADFERDYLLPQFNTDWSGFKRKCASYADVTAYSSCLRKMIFRPTDGEMVIPEDLATFWTEHSERATLPTGLALLGLSSADRNMVGRWKPEASDTYVRAYNGLIAQFQSRFGLVLRCPDRSRRLDEVDIIESAAAWIRVRRTDIGHGEESYILGLLETSLDAFVDKLPDVEEDPEMSNPVDGCGRAQNHRRLESDRTIGQTIRIRGGQSECKVQSSPSYHGWVLDGTGKGFQTFRRVCNQAARGIVHACLQNLLARFQRFR